MITTFTQTHSKGNGAIPGARPVFAPLTLESLGLMSEAALEQQFNRGSVPVSLNNLDGVAKGRILRLVGWAGRAPIAPVVRHFTSSRLFPWRGKNLRSRSRGQGSGVNRVHLLGHHKLLPFRTLIEPSMLDGQPCICIDYDRPENPRLVRRFRDELREVSPGLFMGPALVKIGQGYRALFYFALEVTGKEDT